MRSVSRPQSYLFLFLVFFSMISYSVYAEIPRIISYQGKVTDGSGNPVSDGSYNMRFSIYDVETGGSSLWYSGLVSVQVTDGLFSVLLGDSPQSAIELPFDTDYWLNVWIEGDTQTPRQKLGSVGYAYMASGLVPGTEVSGSVGTESMSAFKGVNAAASGSTFGLYGVNSSTAGTGVRGDALATAGTTFGVRGASQSTSGAGVYGSADATTGTTYGIYGLNFSGSGRGVYGVAAATSGVTYGVYGETVSGSGRGVYGVAGAGSGTTYGVYGQSSSWSGIGVLGYAEASSGNTVGVSGLCESPTGKAVSGQNNATEGTATGVFGFTSSTSGRAVSGFASSNEGSTYGVYGHSASENGRGVYGWASATSGDTYGVYGVTDSPSGYGVYGTATTTIGYNTGVYGTSASQVGYGVRGYNTATTGTCYGGRFESESDGGRGVYGYASSSSGITYGVYGRSDSPSGYGVYYSGGINGSGLMRTVVLTSRGPTGLDIVSAAGSWVEDFGEDQLMNGRCHIELDPLFLETVSIDDSNHMKVFVTPDDPDCEGVAVIRGITGFDVIELHDGTSDTRFAYRVVARRKGFEEKRLDYINAAESDPYLFPESE